MFKILRIKAYLKHEYLRFIDVDKQVFQELHDELLILKLIELKDKDGKQIIVLTDAGYKRLAHRHFQKEHWKIIKREVKDYFLVITTYKPDSIPFPISKWSVIRRPNNFTSIQFFK